MALVGETTIEGAIRWLQLGACDVRSPWTLTAQSVAEARGSRGTTVERVLGWAQREGLTGELRVLDGTPLEGVAVFEAGALHHATFCALEGERALEEILAMEDTELTFSTNVAKPQRRYAPRVLVAEDDESLRKLLVHRLERAGYRVFQAADGLEGYTVAQREKLDAVVTDLEMPRLDGWGLLRTLREDPALRELPVVLLSAHDDMIDTLKAARGGARAYLKKTGHARELLAALSLLTEPRQRVFTALSARTEAIVELPAVGATWLLETIAELDVRGRLELEDDLGRYEVTLSNGRLLDAVAQVGSLRVENRLALEAVIASRSRGRFVFIDRAAWPEAPWLFDALADVNRGLSLAAAARLR